jgi:hypothetical protein
MTERPSLWTMINENATSLADLQDANRQMYDWMDQCGIGWNREAAYAAIEADHAEARGMNESCGYCGQQAPRQFTEQGACTGCFTVDIEADHAEALEMNRIAAAQRVMASAMQRNEWRIRHEFIGDALDMIEADHDEALEMDRHEGKRRGCGRASQHQSDAETLTRVRELLAQWEGPEGWSDVEGNRAWDAGYKSAWRERAAELRAALTPPAA